MPGDRLFFANRSSGPAGRGLSATAYVDTGETGAWPSLNTLHQFPVSEIRGRQAVLALAPELRDLALRCGQKGLVDHLEYYLSVPYFGHKLPCVLLFHSGEGVADGPAQGFKTDSGVVSGRHVLAAVLLHEYRLAGIHTGTYIPADLAGDWTILAPVEYRERIARRAAAHLLRHGAALVLLAKATGPGSPTTPPDVRDEPLARSERTTLRTLPLAGSMDQTLARMGSHTRRNLRLARRRAIVQLQATFVAESPITQAQFLKMNREGFYPVPDAVARWRFQSVHSAPGGFLAGVQTSDGTWIALLGGRRFQGPGGAYTTVDWQLNRTGFARFSPGSLIRSFLIEHEIARGTSYLRFEGGTPHSMRSAFEPEILQEWLYARPLLTPAFLRGLGKLLPKGNLLGDFLNSPEIRWREGKRSS